MLRRFLVFSAIFLMLFALAFLLEWGLRTPQQIAGAQVFEQLFFKFEHEPESAWRSVSLPHNWDESEPGKGGVGVYRTRLFLLEIPKEPIGFYLPKLSMNAEILLNGVSIGSGGSMQEPVARYWNQPLYLVLPTGLWRVGDNIVQIRVFGYANNHSGLGAIIVGRNSLLLPRVENYRLRLLLLDIGSFSINLVLGLVLLFWAVKTGEIAIFYFAVGALLSSIVIADSFWIEVPLHRFSWRWITLSANFFSIIFFYLFMLKMLEKPVNTIGKVFMAVLVAGTLALLLASSGELLPWARWLRLITLLMMLQLVFVSIKGWMLEAKRLHLWLGACMWVVLVLGIVDWLPMMTHSTKSSPYLFYLGPVAFSFAVALGLLSRYIHALEIEKNHTELLRQSLKRQQQDLQQQHQRITQLENERVVHEERDRIVRELHDGIGGQLMGALTLSENQDSAVEKQVRYALDELRVIMDSLDTDADFLTMLGMFRHRMEKDLQRQNITLRWAVDEVPPSLEHSPEKSLHGMRIIQEAVANTIKYARAGEIRIEVKSDRLVISDDGVGVQDEKRVGRGLKNMRWRSEQLGASFDFESSAQGTRVIVSWKP